MSKSEQINLDVPRWDQNTFIGRFRYFFAVTDPRLCFASEEDLGNAKSIVMANREGKQNLPRLTKDQLYDAKHTYDSAFHPDTGEKMYAIGRMSRQVPGGMLITGAMLTWYRTAPAVIFWQCINQTFNAVVNYTNRNAQSTVTDQQMAVAYFSAIGAATATALSLNSLTAKSPPLLRRYVPFAAVAAANCINIPLMRQREIADGMVVTDKDGNVLGKSRRAAVQSVVQVSISRITMAMPGMLLIPILMQRVEKMRFFRPVLSAPIQTLLCGVSLIFMVPFGCALFPQKSSMLVSRLEPSLRQQISEKHGSSVSRVYFNKGL